MAVSIWRDYLVVDLVDELTAAALQLVSLGRSGELVNVALVASVVHCLGIISFATPLVRSVAMSMPVCLLSVRSHHSTRKLCYRKDDRVMRRQK